MNNHPSPAKAAAALVGDGCPPGTVRVDDVLLRPEGRKGPIRVRAYKTVPGPTTPIPGPAGPAPVPPRRDLLPHQVRRGR